MESEKIINDITKLPPEAQRQVIDFIEFLRTRYTRSQKVKTIERKDIGSESFIGIWKDRKDMEDSNIWVRNIRESEWGGKS